MNVTIVDRSGKKPSSVWNLPLEIESSDLFQRNENVCSVVSVKTDQQSYYLLMKRELSYNISTS